MEYISSRVQLSLVALGYAAVLLVAALLLYGRHLQELKYPAEASGGMWAAGDAMLTIFIVCLFMVPTTFLIWVIARFEIIAKVYSQFLLGLSLSAPVCLGVFSLGEGNLTKIVGAYCLFRLLGSPFILFGIGVSRLATRFDPGKKLISYALFVEGLTLATSVVLLIHAWVAPNNR